MGAWLRLLLVVAHLGAIAFPCPEPALAEAAAERAPELHALCHCGCDEEPPAARTASLAVALLPATTTPVLPRATSGEAPTRAAQSAHAHAPEPVPRPA
jgi:hypothetical protein